MGCCNCCCPEGEECCKAPGPDGICCTSEKCCGTSGSPACCGEFEQCCNETCCAETVECCGDPGVCCLEGQYCCGDPGECQDEPCGCDTAEDCDCVDIGWTESLGEIPRACCPPGYESDGEGYCDDGVNVVASSLLSEIIQCCGGECLPYDDPCPP